MTQTSTTITTSGPWTAPSTLVNGSVQWIVVGASGGTGDSGQSPGQGAALSGTIAATPLQTFNIIVGLGGGVAAANLGGVPGTATALEGGAGANGGDHGGGAGGGGSAVESGSTPLIVAGGGAGSGGAGNTAGATQQGSAGAGALGGSNGQLSGQNGTVASGGTTAGAGGLGGASGSAGSGGAGGGGTHTGTAGSGGSSWSGGGAGGAGGPGAANDGTNSGGGGAGGGGGYGGGGGGGGGGANGNGGGGAGAGAGGSYFDPSVYNSGFAASGLASSASGYVTAVYSVSDAPFAPLLVAPVNSTAVSATVANTFTFSYQPGPDSGIISGWTFRIKITGASSYSYWNQNAGSLQSTEVVNTTGIVQNADGSYSIVIPANILSNGNIYNWSVNTVEANYSLEGTYAADNTLFCEVLPTVSITGPSGSIVTPVPTITWAVS